MIAVARRAHPLVRFEVATMTALPSEPTQRRGSSAWNETAREFPLRGGSGKADPRRIDPTVVLKPNGVMTIDDYGPMVEWPPMFEGNPDTARIDWLTDPLFVSTEVTVAEHMAVLVCRRRPPSR